MALRKMKLYPTGMRLHEWIALEDNYWADEGIEAEYMWDTIRAGYSYKAEAYKERPQDQPMLRDDGAVTNACAWGSVANAGAGMGKFSAGAYGVARNAIFVKPDSPINAPEDLAGVPIGVGLRAGSHFSALQALEAMLTRAEIKFRFIGLPLDRLALMLDRKVQAANLFGAQLYILEQQGFRKVVDTTFMIGFLITGDADLEDVEKYFRALQRAQRDIDQEPEVYKHYFLKELPEKYHQIIDVRAFGPGERLVFEPYTREVFEKTHRWMQSWNLFPEDQVGHASYDAAVLV